MICYIAPFKDSVNLGLYRGALLADEKKLLNGTGKLLRHVKIIDLEKINDDNIIDLLQQARNERLG